MSASLDVMAWLLEGRPSIRRHTLRVLTSAPPDDMATQRALVVTTGWGANLLEMQEPDGMWGGRPTLR